MEHIVLRRQAPPGAPPVDPTLLPHDSLQANIILASVLCFLIACACVALRFYTRRVIVRISGWEDHFLLLSLFFACWVSIGEIHGATLGLGAHIWDIPPENLVAMFKVQLYCDIAYLLTATFTKLSVLILYRKIFATASTTNRIANHAVTWLVVITSTWVAICTVTTCIPLDAWWDRTILNPRCWSNNVWFFNSSLHLITDWLIFCLPMPMLRRLNVPRRQHIFLIAVFSFGFFVCFVSIIRLVILVHVQNDPTEQLDFTYNLTSLSYWNVVEVNFGIVVACAITLRPLAARLMPRLFAYGLDRRSDNSGPNMPPIETSKGSSSNRHNNNNNRRGELTNFEADIWLESQLPSKSPSDASTVVGASDPSSRRSKTALNPKTAVSPAIAAVPSTTQVGDRSFLTDLSEKNASDPSVASQPPRGRHLSGFLESASDEEGTSRDEELAEGETRVYIRR